MRQVSTARTGRAGEGRGGGRVSKGPLHDEDIPYAIVTPVNPETNSLEPPVNLQTLLASINRQTHFYELVSRHPTPVVKLVSKRDAYLRQRDQTQRQREQRARAIDIKEIQMTWSIGVRDLQHKLDKMRSELGKGNVINLVIAKKKGVALPSPQLCEQKIKDVLDALGSVAVEHKTRTTTNTLAVLYLAPKPQSAS
jgi:translation initiation factor IF-3